MAVALGCAAMSALLMLWFLVRRPTLTKATKLVLFLGIGALPLTTATTGNVADFEGTKDRKFCGSCHVMEPWAEDSDNPASKSLAARHARNAMFGDDNCYACHANYGMFGTIVTKAGGMRHVYEYLFHYRNMSPDEAADELHIREPFQNATCMHCHSTEGPLWNKVKDHTSALDQVRDGSVSCASAGCHGPAHPFSRQSQQDTQTAAVLP